jgi:tyrosyl-tRNA synthetase
MPTVDEQIDILTRGVERVVPEDEFRAKIEKSIKTGVPLRVKLGLDPTAPDIHLGFAVVLRRLRRFQDLGHEVDLVIGDFTGAIGDPTGKSLTRPRLTEEQITANAKTYEQQLYKILLPERTTIHRNSRWLGKLTFADLIGILAKFTVARLLEREDFSNRLASGQPLHVHEIMYPVAQALDSVELGSDVEVGGLDQTFNIMAGRDLLRENGQEPQVGFFMPILVGLDGEKKMSKSLGNYIGIFEPAAEQFGKTMSIPDSALAQWFTLCTDVPLPEVESLIAEQPMAAKKRLGREIVTIYHGAEAAAEAQAAWESQFSRREVPEDMPEAAISAADLDEDGTLWAFRLVQHAGLAQSGKEAKRLVQQGGVSLNGEKVTDPEANITIKGGDILKVGRKYARITLA